MFGSLDPNIATSCLYIDISIYYRNTTILSNEELSRTRAIMGTRFGSIDPNLVFMMANIMNFFHPPKCEMHFAILWVDRPKLKGSLS